MGRTKRTEKKVNRGGDGETTGWITRVWWDGRGGGEKGGRRIDD